MRYLPTEGLRTRPLYFTWLADCSGSMTGTKIDALNQAVQEALEPMRKVAADNPAAQIMVRTLCIRDQAEWLDDAIALEDFAWSNLEPGGTTALGGAMLKAAELLDEISSQKSLPPVFVLLSDGAPTDNFQHGFERFWSHPWAEKSVRIAIAIGEDVEHQPLESFIANQQAENGEPIPVLTAHNAAELKQYIRWVSTAVLQSASSPASRSAGSENSITNLPQRIQFVEVDQQNISDEDLDVW